MRPCFSSTALRRLKVSTSPSAERPRGSQKPTGACTPSSPDSFVLYVVRQFDAMSCASFAVQVSFERTKRRVCVQRPVAPCGARESVLEKPYQAMGSGSDGMLRAMAAMAMAIRIPLLAPGPCWNSLGTPHYCTTGTRSPQLGCAKLHAHDGHHGQATVRQLC